MSLSSWLLALVAGAAAVTDLRWRRIPNWLTLPALAAALALGAFERGWTGLGAAAAGMGVALAIYLPLFAVRAVGGGDVKLMAAMGAAAGYRDWLLLFVLTAVTGGVLALAITLAKGRLGRTLANTGLILRELAHGRAPYRASEEVDVTREAGVRLPHAVSIAVGTALLLVARSG